MRLGFVRSRRTLVVLGLCALAVIGAVLAFVASDGGGSATTTAMPTTGAYRPITFRRPNIPLFGGVFLGDPTADTGGDLQVVLSPLPARNHFKLTFANTSSIGYIDAFEWFPPPGVQVVRVTGSTAGRCALTGIGGFGGNQFKSVVLHPHISCSGLKLRPPTCTCRADGGEADVSFVATKDPGLSGVSRVVAMTPVLQVIPSYVTAGGK